VKRDALDLNVVVAAEQKMLGRLIGENIQLDTRLSPALGQAMADAGQLHQVLMNLLVNARDAMPGGGTVTIETKNVELDGAPYVYLGVSDTGAGMSEEVKRHLFEPFFTTKEPGKGTGLGLATIYGIVVQSGGKIEVESKLGEGSAFHIYLPRVKAIASGQVDAGAAAALPRGSETVLVVEDKDDVRGFVRSVLESCGYRVIESGNPIDALTLAGRFEGPIHLLVTDVVLPQLSGPELAAKLRGARPGARVLFISGSDEAAAGLVYLAKPFSPEQLAVKVREVLAAAGESV
jgi:CheY-like chemotaxis protein